MGTGSTPVHSYTHSRDLAPTQLPVFIKSQTYTVIISSLRPSVYQAPANGAEIPPRPHKHSGGVA